MSGIKLRLHKAMAMAGVASRRKAERMILAGSVRVNGEVVRKLGLSVVAGEDILEVEGRPLEWESISNREVWALYKPKGCITTLHDPQGRPTVRDFFPRTEGRLFPVGRLDHDAEGLILLTNDGALANRVSHPSHGVPKTYLVKIKGIVTNETLKKFRRGPMVGGHRHKPVSGRILHHINDKTWVEVTLKEGINHHIKKMFSAEGFKVLKIKRYSIGPVALEDMTPGQTRRLSRQEIATLSGESAAKSTGKSRGAPDRPRRLSG